MTTMNTLTMINQSTNLLVQANTDASGVTAGVLIAAIAGALVLTGALIGLTHWFMNR